MHMSFKIILFLEKQKRNCSVLLQSTITTYVCVFIVYIMSLSLSLWSRKDLPPPSTNLTNTPLSMKHTWKTEQPTSAFPVWRRQSEQCFLTGELQAFHTLIQTQLFLHQQVLGSQKILLSLAVVCQIVSFLPTYTQSFQYYL